MKNFINIADVNKSDLRMIIDHAKSEKEKRSKMVDEGLKTIVKYDWKTVGKLYLDIYGDLLH